MKTYNKIRTQIKSLYDSLPIAPRMELESVQKSDYLQRYIFGIALLLSTMTLIFSGLLAFDP